MFSKPNKEKVYFNLKADKTHTDKHNEHSVEKTHNTQTLYN